MKKMKLWMMAAILFCGAGCLVSCHGNADADKAAEDTVAVEKAQKVDPALVAIDKYLVDSIGSQYAQGEMCIPVIAMTCSNGLKNDSLYMWGDFWVFNYKVDGDTLKTVSVGNHAGKMLLLKDENGQYQVVSFEQVEDGSNLMPSAKRIFGEYYDAYQAANSDEAYREKARAISIADYVKANSLPVKYYQDFGWPAKEIPAPSDEPTKD